MPSATDDPVYRWLRVFGLVCLASFGYLMILGPLVVAVFEPSVGAAAPVGTATNRGVAETLLALLESLAPWFPFGVSVLAGVAHVRRGVGLRPLGVFLVAQVGVSFLVLVLTALTGGLPGTVSLVASYLLPALYVAYEHIGR